MTGWPISPVIVELDTWPWLQGLGAELGHRPTLAQIPAHVWDRAVPQGVDAVWLMGVWERSPAGLEIARRDDTLQRSLHTALPDLLDEDVVGSPYCVRRYVVDARLGGPEGLAVAREQLARRGVRLILDYVPNHIAPDHPWVLEHPEYLIQGTDRDAEAAPGAWFLAGGRLLARGRDPYFPPWPDVVQLDAFEPRMRTATADTLISIGDQCDGVRCDMAMLLINDIFARTWNGYVSGAPSGEFWPGVIERVRERHADLVLIAEAYWDLESTLLEQGFDFCYDKRLYDRLAHEEAASIRAHLQADLGYQRRLVRFIENHDEPRAAATFTAGNARAAAVAVATLPGATLWHDGQFEGRRVRAPVFLARKPDEPVDESLHSFYRQLLSAVAAGALRADTWALLESQGWPDNQSHRSIVAWAWHDGDRPHHVVVVNYSDQPVQGLIPLPWSHLQDRRWDLIEAMDGDTYTREGNELVQPGLYVDLAPWGYHVLAVVESAGT